MDRLTPLEFRAAWEALRLGEPPMLLELPAPGETIEERDRLFAGAVGGLAGRGLSDGRRPVGPLREALRLLARPDYVLDIRLAGPSVGEAVLGLGAVAGAHGVVVVAAGGALTVRLSDGARVAAALLALAGPMTPGAGRPTNLPAAVLDAACLAAEDGSLWTLADELEARGVARLDAASLVRMCQGIRTRGQLGATGHFGERPRRGPWVVGFHRTDGGWFLQLRAGGTVTVCPTDRPRLMARWRTLVEEFRHAA